MTQPQAPPLTDRRYTIPFLLITGLFFLWALGVNLNDILIPHFKKTFALNDFQSSFIQAAFFGGYFLAALPAGWLMSRIGYNAESSADCFFALPVRCFLSLRQRQASTTSFSARFS